MISRTEQEAETRKSKAEKKAYLERKKRLFEEEQENFDRIIFLRGTGGFWVVGGHSGIILANKIAPELKIRVALKRDTDFDVKFKEGVINLRNLDFYTEKFKNSNYLEKGVERSESAVIFKLKEKISSTEYDILARSKEIRRQKLEAMIEKSVPMPKLNIRMTDVLKLTYKFYRKNSDNLARDFVVEKLVEDIRIAHKTMLMVFREQIDAKEGARKMRARLELALCDLTQIIALEVWTIENCTTLATMMVETEILIDAEIKKIERAEKEESEGVKKVKKLIEKNR